MEKLDFKSFDEQILKCYLFKPRKKPKGIVQIVHGLEEHGLRYSEFAKFLNRNGYIVFVCDQRLHGKTAGENLSVTDIEDVFPIMVKDQILISDMLIKEFDLSLIIFGHSYGSFIVQKYLQSYHKHCGAILSGSGYMKRPEVLAGEIVSWAYLKLKGGESISNTIENLVIGSFNKPFKKDNGSWISANKENIEKYQKDPLCGNPLCANFYYSMFKNTRKLYSEEGLSSIDKNTPILLASGRDDPVGEMSKGVRKLYDTYRRYGIDCTLKLYFGKRHEILNEGDPTVQEDMLKFIDNIISKKALSNT